MKPTAVELNGNGPGKRPHSHSLYSGHARPYLVQNTTVPQHHHHHTIYTVYVRWVRLMPEQKIRRDSFSGARVQDMLPGLVLPVRQTRGPAYPCSMGGGQWAKNSSIAGHRNRRRTMDSQPRTARGPRCGRHVTQHTHARAHTRARAHTHTRYHTHTP